MVRVIESVSADRRLSEAHGFVDRFSPSTEILVVGASRGAADDFARAVAASKGASFGLYRFSLTQLAARIAASSISGAALARGTDAGGEAIAARAVFDLISSKRLEYFEPVAGMPGFPKALARTVHELRLAGVPAERLLEGGTAEADIGRLLARVESDLEAASIADRAALFGLAADACRTSVRWVGLPLVLLDVPLDARAERAFVSALVAQSPETLATIPEGDDRARAAWVALGAAVQEGLDTADEHSDLAPLRRHIFKLARPPARRRAGDVRLFSAPGEGREAVEIVRRLLDEAAAGVPRERIARHPDLDETLTQVTARRLDPLAAAAALLLGP